MAAAEMALKMVLGVPGNWSGMEIGFSLSLWGTSLPHHVVMAHEWAVRGWQKAEKRDKRQWSWRKNTEGAETTAEGRVDRARNTRGRQSRGGTPITPTADSHFGLLSLFLCIPAASGICCWDQSRVVPSVNQDLSAHQLKIQTDKRENWTRTTPVLPGVARNCSSNRTHTNTTQVIPEVHREHFFSPIPRAGSFKWFLELSGSSKDRSNVWDFQALSAFAAVSSYNPAFLPSGTKWALPNIQYSPQTTFKLIWHPSCYNNPGSEAPRLTLGLPCTLQPQ